MVPIRFRYSSKVKKKKKRLADSYLWLHNGRGHKSRRGLDRQGGGQPVDLTAADGMASSRQNSSNASVRMKACSSDLKSDIPCLYMAGSLPNFIHH